MLCDFMVEKLWQISRSSHYSILPWILCIMYYVWMIVILCISYLKNLYLMYGILVYTNRSLKYGGNMKLQTSLHIICNRLCLFHCICVKIVFVLMDRMGLLDVEIKLYIISTRDPLLNSLDRWKNDKENMYTATV